MIKKLIENPFSVNVYQGSDYFCDRESETNRLLSDIRNGSSVTLFSIRRIGKTGLLHHLLNQLPVGWKGIYIDILATENLNQFLNLLATAIIKSVPEKSPFGKRIWTFIKSLRPMISFDNLTGEPQASFDIKRKDVELNINSVLQFLEQQDLRILIVIDEFQQIVHYPEQNTDAWLRTIIQKLSNITFIFSGSQQHLMLELFTAPQRPFYRSTQLLKLEKLDKVVYCDFIILMFQKYNKEISSSQVMNILEWTDNHTYYVQLICNRVFSATKKKVTDELWRHQANQLLQEQESIFFYYRNMLTTPQWQLLKAIAQYGLVYMPTSKEFLTKNQLGTSATVIRSLKSLVEYELVYSDFNSKGEKFYSVYDVFFHRWCKG